MLEFIQSYNFTLEYLYVLLIVLLLLAIPTILWLVTYTSANLSMLLGGPVDLKKKYNAKWVLVTGAGTGIGRALSNYCAEKGLNVVLVSLPDKHLDEAAEQLRSMYPKQEFRAIATKFDHKTDYLTPIIEGTKDIDVNVVFNNAGYIVTGFMDTTSLDAQLANMECNSTSCLKLTHHFVQLMIQKKLKGCIVFTSSVSGYIPNPFAVVYGATKAFVSQFAASLAIEVRSSGIDVVAVHPSPVASNFFDKAHKLDSLEMAQRAAVLPITLPPKIFSCISRGHVADIGVMAVCVRIIVAIVPYDFLTGVFSFFAPVMSDFKKHNKNRGGIKSD